MRGLITIVLLTLATAVAAEEPDTPPIEWGTWYDGHGNRADTGIADTDGDDWLTVVADGKAVLEIRFPTAGDGDSFAARVLQLERQVADLTRRLEEAERRKAELYGRGTEPLTIQTEPPSNTLEVQPGSYSHFDGCNWTLCDGSGNCSSTMMACPQARTPPIPTPGTP